MNDIEIWRYLNCGGLNPDHAEFELVSNPPSELRADNIGCPNCNGKGKK